jgi:hypothetical protein
MIGRKHHTGNGVMSEQSPCPDGVVDMELACVTCRTRLYVSDASIDAVLASLERAGRAILVCWVCGQTQVVRWKVPHSRLTHD